MIDALKGGTISTSSEIVAHFLSVLLQGFMAKMKNVISPQEIITRVVTHASAAGIRLGEFKDVMLNMLELNDYELLLNQTVLGIFKEDVVHSHEMKFRKMVSQYL